MSDARQIADAEAVEALAAALRSAGGRPLPRSADVYLATIAAEALHDRLALAGLVLARPCPEPRLL